MPSGNVTAAIDNLAESVDTISAVTAFIGSIVVVFMLVAIFAGLAAWLTTTMFRSRDFMLGFPSAIFWAFLGALFYLIPSMFPSDEAFYYEFWTVAWWRMIAFACFGMVIFCVIGMYGLRKKDLNPPDIGEGKYIDEDDSLELPTPEVEKSKIAPKKNDERELSPRERADERRMKREEK